MNAAELHRIFAAISREMAEKRDYLVELDARSGDGDLGISMSQGYAGAEKAIADGIAAGETDLGRLLMKASRAFNEAAPSSLGTIISVGIMGMAKALKGKTECTGAEAAAALIKGVEAITERTGSKAGEKTFLDALIPASEALEAAFAAGRDSRGALAEAAKAAADGCEATKQMLPVHGRAAYYGDKLLGFTDGGAEAGKFMFAALVTL